MEFIGLLSMWVAGVTIVGCTLYICIKKSELTAAQAIAFGVGASLIALSFVHVSDVWQQAIKEAVKDAVGGVAREAIEEYFRRGE